MPCTRSSGSTTAIGSAAHLAGADRVVGGLGVLAHPVEQLVVRLQMRARRDLLARDLLQRRRRHQLAAPCGWRPARRRGRAAADRKLKRIAGGSAGSADLMWIEPVLSERSTFTFMVMPALARDAPLAADHLVEEGRDRDRGVRRLEARAGCGSTCGSAPRSRPGSPRGTARTSAPRAPAASRGRCR